MTVHVMLMLLAALVVGCAGVADDGVSSDVAEAAVELDAAARELEAHLDQLRTDPEQVEPAWSDVRQRVADALAAADADHVRADLADADPSQRSAFRGFRRGLELAAAATADVHARLEEGAPSDEVARSVIEARQRMEAIDNLRDALPGVSGG